MPEIQYFIVEETREVKVVANSIEDAVLIAGAAFKHGQNADCGVARGLVPEKVWGNTQNKIKTVEVKARRER